MPPDTPAALLAAARTRFLERGFASTSMEEIRREAGVSNGSLFHHFPTKNHLARALYLSALVSFQDSLRDALVGEPGRADGIERLIRAYLDWITEHRAHARVLLELRDATAIDGEQVDWAHVNEDALGALHSFIARCVAAGDMLDVPFEVWMALVFAPVLELTRHWTAHPTRSIPPPVRAALARAAVRAVEPMPTSSASAASPARPQPASKPTRKSQPTLTRAAPARGRTRRSGLDAPPGATEKRARRGPRMAPAAPRPSRVRIRFG